MDMASCGTQPVQSKNEAFDKLERPNTWGDLCVPIGIFGFYSKLFTLYQLYIRLWRYILPKQPQPGTVYQKEGMELMQNLWNIEDQRLLERLNKNILSGPTL